MADEDKLRQYLKKATGDLQHTARRLREAELKDSEPVAIVGIGCRFPPGLRSADELWRFVADGGDGVSAFPADRGWGAVRVPGPDPSVRPAAGRGGFVAGADRFDAGFFGIGANEALAMDPQQRMLLETAWEAVEHAGLDPAALRGSQTGVYAGVSYCHYAGGPQSARPAGIEDQLIVGGTPSTNSGRVAYVLGLHGPAISIDTACSSSLVAIHLACQGLRRGDCDLALAGGATVMATPNVILEFGRRGALAGDGRCKPFADAADGMGFGEGAGLLVLERLSVALRNGREILAVIRGSAVNQDGATNGLTSPSRAAQEAVIGRALADAGLTPDQVDAVEGHGTGTALGDAIEAEALIAAYGQGRSPDRPLRLGSVKSNIGHTQTASGVAGVIKTVMSMRAGIHARTLHVDRPSAHVDWSAGTVVLTTESAPWPAAGRPRRAGVSAFGISGTNAHLILEEPAAADRGASAPPAGSGGGRVPWVLSAKTEPALRAMAVRLGEFLAARPAAAADVGLSLARTRAGFGHRAVSLGADTGEHLAALAALARGEGAPGLSTATAATAHTTVLFTGDEPGADAAAWREARCLPAFAEAYDEVHAALAARLDQPPTAYPDAAVFALQVALFHAVRAYGVAPDVVAGSGIGEITAAFAAGVLSLADAAAIAAAAALTRDAGRSGARDGLRAAAESADYAKPQITLITSGEPADSEHWARGLFLGTGAEDVRAQVLARGAANRLELDPGTVTCADELLTLLAAAYTAGTEMSWEPSFAGTGARQVTLPGYPFQRERYWLDPEPARDHGEFRTDGQPVHPLLGGVIDLADPAERRFARTPAAREPWYVAQYRLRGAPALPAGAVAEWALAAAQFADGDPVDGGGVRTVENLVFGEPATVPGPLGPALQTAAETRGADRRIRGFSAGPAGAWTERFTALAAEPTAPVPPRTDLGQLRSRMAEQDPGALFGWLDDCGIACGPDFRQALGRWWRTDDEALALIETDPAGADHGEDAGEAEGKGEDDGYLLHPVVLEACFLAASPLVAGDGLRLPSSLSRLARHREPPRRVWCHARRTPGAAIDLDLYDDTGEPFASVAQLVFRAAGPAGPADAPGQPEADEPWDADRLCRLAVEDPPAARRELADLLFTRVGSLVEGLAENRPGLREHFGAMRLGDLGLDSLRAMRLRRQLRAGLHVDVPPQRLLGDGTAADIVDLVCRSLAARSLVATGDEPAGDAGPAEELIL
ncbi:MAG TPA: beta-ketoacyl synthase N-terminal-like domain-containing protein [Actinocrinis sp.]|nr:beta-ketoacyl synthase N-terminal-like domain-containing protein [Actinocrinis sp.]